MNHRKTLGTIAAGALGGVMVMLLLGTAWITPRTWVDHVLVTASMLNEIRDELLFLKESQNSVGGFFRGLQLRTNPDADVQASQVQLVDADQIVMDDGTGVADWPVLTASITTSGAAGLDTGAEAASTWYEIYAIRKSSDATRNLLLHQAPDNFIDESQFTFGGSIALRDASARTSIAQGFQTDESKPIVMVAAQIRKVGSPTGQIYLTIESDSAGSPSSVLATSDKLDISGVITASQQWVLFIFRAPVTVTAGTQYHIRYNGTWAVSGANYATVGTAGSAVYARGQIKSFDGASTWTGSADDATFSVSVYRNVTSVTMPSGYDQKCLIGYVYNDSSSDFTAFEARDRRVIALSSQTIFSNTLTTLSPVALNSIVPPRPVTIWVYGNVGAAGTILKLAPVPRGYTVTAAGAPRASGDAGIVAANNTVALLGDIHTEMQQSYGITNGAATVYLSEWEW